MCGLETGIRNLILGVLVGIGALNALYSYTTFEEFLHIVLALLLACAVFVNLWRETILWFLISAVAWELISGAMGSAIVSLVEL